MFDFQPIPCMFILMTHKAEEAYDNVWQFMKTICPSFIPESYMSDHELALHNSLESAFPDILPKHCYFHYAQASFINYYIHFDHWLSLSIVIFINVNNFEFF